jgi:hypothetical protein
MKRKRRKRITWNLRHLRLRAYRTQNGLCYWCKRPMDRDPESESDARLTADHLVPIYAGGKTRPGNISLRRAPSATIPVRLNSTSQAEPKQCGAQVMTGRNRRSPY